MSHLLPCPFCGENVPEIEHMEGTILHPAYVVKCGHCGAQAPWCDKGDHEANWNQRAKLRAPVADVPVCQRCGGTGEADSGGIHPWGAPALIPCECTIKPPAQNLSADELADFMGDQNAMAALADGLESIKDNENAELAAVIIRRMASAPVAGEATDADIRAVFMAHGFTVKEGQTDLKPYVYAAARALLSRYAASQASECECTRKSKAVADSEAEL